MADLFSLTDLGVADDNSTLSTGDLRRKYNFGNRVSELAIAQDPFFRFVSKLAKKPTDDPQFKFTARKPSFHKRYAYAKSGGAAYDDALTVAFPSSGTVVLEMGGDYAHAGNKTNVYGNTVVYEMGVAATCPQFFIPGQMVKVPLSSASGGGTYGDYAIIRIDEGGVAAGAAGYKRITGTIVRGVSSHYLMGPHSSIDNGSVADEDTAVSQEALEPYRAYVIGTSFAQGSGYPETWKDQPFSTGYGNTQIWKTAMAMDNTTRATVLKYDSSEWARVWKEKLIEHKFDIEQSLLFNGAASSSGSEWTTDGIVSYISSYGNQFSLPLATKSQDSFLDDLSAFLDPRYNNSNATLFFVSTAVYNWLHKLSGYFANNIANVQPGGYDGTAAAAGGAAGSVGGSMGRADMSLMGKKKVFGVDITVISTPYGDMNVARNIHLDGTDIGMLAVNMKHVAYRPLVGNGLNRDTAIYVGVQTLENSGVDRRVDLIQTEAALQVEMPEAHGIWIAS